MLYCVEIYEYECKYVTVDAENRDDALAKAIAATKYTISRFDFHGVVTEYKEPITRKERIKRRDARIARSVKESKAKIEEVVKLKRIRRQRERDRSLGG